MATAEELLAAELGENILTVDMDARTIVIPKGVTNIGVESDDEVLSLPFRMSRHYHGIDLSAFIIRINYLNAKKGGDAYEVKNPKLTDDTIEFEWIVGRNAATYKGNVMFNVCCKEVDSEGVVLREFNTTVATLPVLEGLETLESVVPDHLDLLEQWHTMLFGAGDTIEQQIINTGNTIKQEVTDSGTAYVEQIVNAGNTVKQEITDLGESYKTHITNSGDSYVAQIITAGDSALSDIVSSRISAKQEVVNAGTSYVDQITNLGAASLSDVNTACEAAKSEVVSTGATVMSEVVNSGNTYVEQITVDGDSYVRQITNLSTTSLSDISAARDAAKSDVSATGSDVKQEIVTTGTSYVTQVTNVGDTKLSDITTSGESYKQQIVETGDTAKQEVADAGSAGVKQITDTGNAVISNINSSFDNYMIEHSEELTGPTGATFIPSISETGDVSWTNDKGLTNPTTVNVRGPQGDPFTYDMFTDEQLEALVGASIDKIERTSGNGAAGTTDTYTITLTDGRTSTFRVYNGADGEGAGDMVAGVYDPQGKNTDVFAYIDDRIGRIDSLLDSINGE